LRGFVAIAITSPDLAAGQHIDDRLPAVITIACAHSRSTEVAVSGTGHDPTTSSR
jgi:hypothetical protein